MRRILRPTGGRGQVEARHWGRLFRFQSMWGLMLGAFCTGYAVWMYQTWLPAYLEMQQHISIAKTGFLASIPLFCSILGAWSGGWFTDRLNARGMDWWRAAGCQRSSACCCRACSP